MENIIKIFNAKWNGTYQSPSLVILAEGYIFLNTAGTFPEKDGSTERIKWKIVNKTEVNNETITWNINLK